VSDGRCFFDAQSRILYHYPDADEPGAVHWVRILPPLPGNVPTGWRYFFKGGQVVEGN